MRPARTTRLLHPPVPPTRLERASPTLGPSCAVRLRHGGKIDLTVDQEPAVGLEPTTSALRKRPLTVRARWQRAVGRHRTGTLRLTEAALSHLSFDGNCRLYQLSYAPSDSATCVPFLGSRNAFPHSTDAVLLLATLRDDGIRTRISAVPQEGLEPPTPSSEDWRSVH